MSFHVTYYSKSGNTRKIADAIASTVGCSSATVDTPLNDTVDVLFLGASVYKFGIDPQVLAYIDRLDPAKVGQVAIFSTSAMSDSGYPKLVDRLTKRGIKVASTHFYCKGSFMFANKNRPNQDDVNRAMQFAQGFYN